MAEQAPSLSEITNFAVDPERGTGTPAVVFEGGQQMVQNLNENSRFQSQNTMDNYKLFLGNLKDAYARGDAIAATDVAPQDREAIQKRLGDVMGKIGKDPSKFFKGGADATALTEELQKVQIDANKSKQDHIYDIAHRDFLERNPTLQTPENMAAISKFSSDPLETRKPFVLTTPPIVDIGKLRDDIVGSDGVTVTGVGVRPYGNDGHYNQEYETSTVKFAPFMQKWNLAPQLHPEIGRYLDNLYNKLPDEQKKNITKDQFWDSLGQRSFGQNKDYYNESKGKLVANTFALEGEKNKDKLEQIKASTKPSLIRAYAYSKKVNADLAKAKDENEKDKILYDEFTDNFLKQKEVVTGVGEGNKSIETTDLPATESLPLFTFDGQKATPLKPFGATPQYIPAPTDKDANATKFVGWVGGSYKQQYLKGNNPIDVKDMWSDYQKM